jgi:hypothetical protein
MESCVIGASEIMSEIDAIVNGALENLKQREEVQVTEFVEFIRNSAHEFQVWRRQALGKGIGRIFRVFQSRPRRERLRLFVAR